MAPAAPLSTVVLVSAVCLGLASTWVSNLDDTSILVQQGMHGKLGVEMDDSMQRVDKALDKMKVGVNKLIVGTADMLKDASSKVASQVSRSVDEKIAAEPVSLIEEDASALAPNNKPMGQKVTELKERVGDRMNKVVTGINKGVTSVNARVEHSVGNMMSKANSAVDDIHSAASNALQGMKDFTDAASEPITKKVNSQSAQFNGKVKVMINKINRAIDDMKGGMHDLAHGITDGMKEASEKIAAQLAQSVHEHVRQEIELARAAEPASLLETGAARHNGGAVMAKAHSAVATIRSAATAALDGMKDLIDTTGETLMEQLSAESAEASSKVGTMLSRTSANIVDVKSVLHDFAHGMTDSLKEASEKIATELTRTVDENVKRELELAMASA